jgi:CRISPR-associated endonuclease/helicase Cas3
MKQMSLRLGPVYSCLASADDLKGLNLARLPSTYKLRYHQAQTWQKFTNSDAEVIFDTALTGDGKSLAGQLPMLADGKYALLLYPTNEQPVEKPKGMVVRNERGRSLCEEGKRPP